MLVAAVLVRTLVEGMDELVVDFVVVLETGGFDPGRH